MNTEPTQDETIAALSLRCDGPDQAERFDRAGRAITDRIEGSRPEGRGAAEAATSTETREEWLRQCR